LAPILHDPAAAFFSLSLTCVVHEDSTHGICGGGEEMPPIVEMIVAGGEQPQIRLVNQRRGLKRPPGPLAGHLARGHLP
jgi:hypothetical protein